MQTAAALQLRYQPPHSHILRSGTRAAAGQAQMWSVAWPVTGYLSFRLSVIGMIFILTKSRVLCARMGPGCCKEIALGYSKNSKITPKLFLKNTVLMYNKTLFMACAIRFVFHLLTGAFQPRVRTKHTRAAWCHSQKHSLHPGKKGLLHCEREPPVVFQLAFSGQLKAKITLPLCFQYCDLMAKWIFSTKHNFVLWFCSLLNGKAV